MRWRVAADAALRWEARDPLETTEIASTVGLDAMNEVIKELAGALLSTETISPAYVAWKAMRLASGLSTLVGPEEVDG
jgi:hypothetical protein